MAFAVIFFWISLFILVYTYFGYGLILLFLNKFVRKTTKRYEISKIEFPAITLVVPVFNEEAVLLSKIENCFRLDYPEAQLKILFISDGSTDASFEIISRFPRIEHLFQLERAGKMAAINRAMAFVTTPYVLFSDANSFLNTSCIKKIIPHYAIELVGGVAGEKKVEYSRRHAAMGFGEGLYWKYESILKQLDSNFNTVIGAAGEVFSMRTSLFTPLPSDTILDDLNLSLKICLNGFKVVYEPDAYAIEAPSANLNEESKRRIRIAAGAFQSILKQGLLNQVFRFPVLGFQFASRRIMRWIFCPIALLLLFFTNLYIYNQQPSTGYLVFLYLQQAFYIGAGFGWLFYGTNARLSVFFIPFYFVFMNVSLVQGFIKFVLGKQSVLWEKSVRSTLQTSNNKT
ncbi:MAG: glycosyltransferase family 2 protein [Chitinophagaceae bacterium]|nr:glycosyltransferase family 2 protein [Chitinophagaceae bacterium]